MLRLFAMLVFLALVFFFFYFLWKKKFLYSLIIAVIFLALFSFGVYLGSTAKNTYCITAHKTFTERPLKFETAKDYYEMGNYQYDLGKCDDAIKSYTKAIELDPTISQIYNNRGYTYMQKGDYKKALADFNKAIEVRPNYVRALINRGDIYNKYLVDRKKAIDDYNKIIAQGDWAIKDTAVCVHKAVAQAGGSWGASAFPGIANVILNKGKCK